MQTSVDGGQLRLLRVRQSGVLDVLLVERRDVLVPEARDRHVEDVLRQNVKRMRRRSARRLRIVHLPPRETHRMEPAGNGVPPRGVRNPFRPVIAARTEEQIAGAEPRSLRADGQSSSAGRPLPSHHEPISHSVPDALFLRRLLLRQSVQAEGAHESRLGDWRPGIRS